MPGHHISHCHVLGTEAPTMPAAPLPGSDVLSRALPWTSGWKDFISTSGVVPLQDFLAGWPWHCCLAMYGVATENYEGTAAKATHLPLGTSAGSVRLGGVLTFQPPYSLKPPGASLVTLPCHPSPGGHGDQRATTLSSVLPLPTSLSSVGGSRLQHSPTFRTRVC